MDDDEKTNPAAEHIPTKEQFDATVADVHRQLENVIAMVERGFATQEERDAADVKIGYLAVTACALACPEDRSRPGPGVKHAVQRMRWILRIAESALCSIEEHEARGEAADAAERDPSLN